MKDTVNNNIDFKEYFNNSYNIKPYRMLSAYLKKKFNEKVYKVSIDAGFTCPNRDGFKAYGGCTFCNNNSFVPSNAKENKNIIKQIKDGKEFLKRRYKAKKFIAYFQSATNTYSSIDKLRKVYRESLTDDEVIGISIGTRPDCVDDRVLDLIEEVSEGYETWIELGLQSIHNKSLEYVNRADTFENFVTVFQKARKRKNIKLCVHLMYGIPTENKDEMLQTAEIVGDMKPDGVKLHQLYISRKTKMEQMYNNNEINLLSGEDYLELVGRSLQILPKSIVIHRLHGDTTSEYLVAPSWSIKSFGNVIDRYLIENNIYQGQLREE